MQTTSLVMAALKSKAPSLYRDPQAKGELAEFVRVRADEMTEAIVSLTQEQRILEKWDELGPLKCAAKMRMADKLNAEAVYADMLEFPQDET